MQNIKSIEQLIHFLEQNGKDEIIKRIQDGDSEIINLIQDNQLDMEFYTYHLELGGGLDGMLFDIAKAFFNKVNEMVDEAEVYEPDVEYLSVDEERLFALILESDISLGEKLNKCNTLLESGLSLSPSFSSNHPKAFRTFTSLCDML